MERFKILKKIIHKLLGGGLPEVPEPAPPTPLFDESDYVRQLYLLSEQNDWAEFDVKSNELLSQNPDHDEVLALAAYGMQQRGRLEEAATLAVRSASLFSSRWLANFVAGFSLTGVGREKEAYPYLIQAVALLPEDRQTILLLIKVIVALDGIEAAATEYIAHCRKTGHSPNIVIAPLRSTFDWAQKTGLSILDAGEVEEIPFKDPHVWGSPPASEIKIALSNKPCVTDISDARIFSNSSIILTSDGVALSDTGGHPQFGRYVDFVYEAVVVVAQQPDKVILDFNEFKTREIEAGIFMSGLASNAFGHWFPDFLPKLQFLQQHPDFANLPLIVDADMPQSHFDHLRRFADNPLILLQANESLLCRRLLVASSPMFCPVELLPNDIPIHEMPGLSLRAMRFLRGGELDDSNIRPDRRIFLARKSMKWRRLLNEDEIATDLSKLGFEIIFIENMTVREQIDLFQQASWIVAPSGSALLNLIFAGQNVKLLVLVQSNLFNWGAFQGPMDALGYQSICVCGDYAQAENQKHSDFQVPVQHIRQALFDMGLSEALA